MNPPDKSKSSQFVVDGQRRIQETEYYKLKVHEIRAAVQSKYQEEITRASLVRRILLNFRIRREINREIEKIAPRHGLYLQRFLRKPDIPFNGNKS